MINISPDKYNHLREIGLKKGFKATEKFMLALVDKEIEASPEVKPPNNEMEIKLGENG